MSSGEDGGGDSKKRPDLEAIIRRLQDPVKRSVPLQPELDAAKPKAEADAADWQARAAERDSKQAHDLRGTAATSTHRISVGWLGFIVAFVTVQVSVSPAWRVSDAVAIAVLTTATANVLALYFTIVKSLFPARATKGD